MISAMTAQHWRQAPISQRLLCAAHVCVLALLYLKKENYLFNRFADHYIRRNDSEEGVISRTFVSTLPLVNQARYL